MPHQRWLSLQGAANARDLGGLPLRSGGQTRFGRLLRCDTLQELTPDDVATFAQFPLSTVLDLRAPAEAAAEGRGLLADDPAITYVNHPFVSDATIVPSDPRHELVVADRQRFDRVEHYLDYLRLAGDQVLDALEVLARPAPGAVVFHCAAGKDRTGVLAALALEAAGVDRQAVLDDYALTNERLSAIIDRLGRLPTYRAGIARQQAADMAAERATMEAFLARVDAEYGDVVGWIARAGGGSDLHTRLEARLSG